jgi:hypothetical protein
MIDGSQRLNGPLSTFSLEAGVRFAASHSGSGTLIMFSQKVKVVLLM